jgi:hypothetical protein
MTPDERRALEALRELPLVGNDDQHVDLGHVTLEDILDGSEPLNISHAGGEFSALTKELNNDLWKEQVSRSSCLFILHFTNLRTQTKSSSSHPD